MDLGISSDSMETTASASGACVYPMDGCDRISGSQEKTFTETSELPCECCSCDSLSDSDFSSTSSTVTEDQDIGGNIKETITSSTTDRDIYIRVKHMGKTGCTWHVLNDSTELEWLPSALNSQPHALDFSAVTAIGHRIYISGGGPDRCDLDRDETSFTTDKVYYIDTRCPTDEWEEVAPMSRQRYQHYAFSEGGKMYVVGGKTGFNQPPLWGEVYDPSQNKWHELPCIGRSDNGIICCFHMGIRFHMIRESTEKEEVLVYTDLLGLLGSVDVKSNSMSIISMKLGRQMVATALNGIIYCINRSRVDILLAFDPSTPENDPVRVTGSSKLKKYLPNRRASPMIHMISLSNNKLAVVWAFGDISDELERDALVVHCSKFQVEKVKNAETGKFNFKAYPIRKSTHFVPGFWLTDCLTLPQEEDVDFDDGILRSTNTDTDTDTDLDMDTDMDSVTGEGDAGINVEDEDTASDQMQIHSSYMIYGLLFVLMFMYLPLVFAF